MASDHVLAYVLYLASWRIAIILCGALSIYLGYRLFALGFEASATEIEATHGNSGLKLRNLAPGTAFAFFGASLIAILVATSPAEIISLPSGAGSVADGSLDTSKQAGGLILRGDD